MTAVVAASALLFTGQASAGATPTNARQWHSPTCEVVDSDGTITYTTDGLKTAHPTTGATHTTKYVEGIVPLSTPDQLLAVDSKGRLYLSRDAGCMWVQFELISGLYYPRLIAGPNGTAYIWGVHSNRLLRVSGTTVTELPAVTPEDGGDLVAVAADRHRPHHLRAVSEYGQVYDSTTDGASFQPVGKPGIDKTSSLYDASIDPNNLNHIVLGSAGEGAYLSRNGGRSWSHTGMGARGERVNAFSVSVSPANGRVVYAQGINISENNAGAPSEGRHIYRSTDGGQTFRPIVDADALGGLHLQNGTLLAPSPTDPNVLYWVFSMSYGGYGTDLWRIDARTGKRTLAHDAHPKLTAIAFNPRDANVMYLGFGYEQIV